ncbi:Clavaminate synthase-like protein [Cyathus striatus]|nr:Clavaminate synthase-like protein [Cyathus striatus]
MSDAIDLIPIPLPPSANKEKLCDFGREVKGIHPGKLTQEQILKVEEALYRYNFLLFRDVDLSPEEQYALVKAFDPESKLFGHGNYKIDQTKSSILHSYLWTIPRIPQVQLIGNGAVKDHEGIPEAMLKHGHHSTFHKTHITPDEESKGATRFFRWHMDAALYDLAPSRVTALYGIKVPQGPIQTVRYDDGTRDELPVTLATTAFASGKIMFDILPPELKSLAVRARAKYAPHPYEWMKPARALSTGIGLETEGLEKSLKDLPPWEDEKIKLWKNRGTGELHLQIHPCAISEILIDPLPGRKSRGKLYPNGGHITDLKDVRDLVYRMQRPGISPSLVYPHPW